MSFETAGNTIRSRFATQFALIQPTVPIHYDNDAGDPPDSGPWVRLTILDGDASQVSLGATRRWRNPGVVTIQVFVEVGIGDGLAREIADDVAAIFRGVTVSGVIFRAPSIRRVGPDGKWYQVNVSTPFQFDILA